MATQKELEQRASNLHGVYNLRFAGHARITRPLEEMDKLIRDTEDLLKDMVIVSVDLKKQVEERLEMYQRERTAIAEAQRGGVDAIRASVLGQRANFAIFRYRRHFAGKSRQTRDLGLLAELIDDLKAIKAQMESLALRHKADGLQQDLEVVTRSLDTYTRERGEIAESRGMGLVDKQVDMWAELANEQFKLYTAHFANKNRASRRPGLLQRMLHSLERLQEQMQSARSGGFRSKVNDQNIKIVTDHLKLYRQELQNIQDSRKEAGTTGIIDALATAANDTMGEYNKYFAGQNRASRDENLLSEICDRMGELERQMYQIDHELDNATNRRNLSIVRDMLALYEKEHGLILQAKKDARLN